MINLYIFIIGCLTLLNGLILFFVSKKQNDLDRIQMSAVISTLGIILISISHFL